VEKLSKKEYLYNLLQKNGLVPKRSAGQNFLICEEVIEAVLLALGDKERLITELGAGLGVLTQALLVKGYRVKAIERDGQLARIMKKVLVKKLRKNLNLIIGDLREEKWEWDEPYVLAGNIPYNLSGLIIRKITELKPAPERVVLLVQKEVGQRLVAGTPNLSLLGLAIQLWGKAEKVLNVPRECFWPEPKVDSQLVLLKPHINNELALEKREKILAVAKRFFQFKRKQVGGTARRLYGKKAEEKLLKLGIDPQQRPQEIEMGKWIVIADDMLYWA
jgi:16S rRNA (adenine1518-N6/adenine1519-N6)-dimethyltransferase